MPVTVVNSLQGDGVYFFNLSSLRNGLNHDEIHFLGFDHGDNEFHYQSGRTYDFVRSAEAEIREAMVNHLKSIQILGNGIDEGAQQQLRSAFGKLFNYYDYKDRLTMEGQQRGETLKLLIFDQPNQHVAHINFSCNTMKGQGNHYTVFTSITCHKFDWFDFQEIDLQGILNAFEGLHVDGQ